MNMPPLKRPVRNTLVLVFGIIILLLINLSIYSKEKLLSKGDIVYLELAPVDPRSLMQGDYMALRFKIGNDIRNKVYNDSLPQHDGRIIITVNKNHIASFKQLDRGEKLQDNEKYLRYRIRNNQVRFATNAFFFKEGTASLYQTARFGKFRVDNDGEMLLVGMYDKDLKKLGESEEGQFSSQP